MKIRVHLVALILVALAAGANAQTESQSKKSLAWSLGSDLSFAGVLHAQPGNNPSAPKYFAKAKLSATALGITLPNLPAKSGDKIKDNAAVLHYLLNSTGMPIMKILGDGLGPQHLAIFEIALKSNILFMMYSPGDTTTEVIAGVIRKRRPDSGLPNVMTDELLGLIAKQAPYAQIKESLMSLHGFAPKFIAVTEFSDNGEAFYANGLYAASAAEFTRALKIDPTGPEYYFSRGRAYVQLGKNNEAIADYTKVIQLRSTAGSVNKNLATVYHNRGLCYGLIAKNALAIADLTNAIKLKPDYASAYKVRGLVYNKMGNAKLANADLQTAERLQPGITK